ncbi:methicillin resistance regulatory protein MecI [Ruminiclostridium hungatei]|uniref:Methicillin resistance regulatory protein MecI n=1 Tax=Ruminiclostridium hungatei TaxID=48256 RepID=A0A1V4SQ99_RUMHU|nr:BlaI/MecI/CopY family transcriptional regulator [Ruminiclostridium hungatei]OPX46042.1 methicillin resistance regulatory protein MecI [Ruminiclostridium hungatei]
MEQIKLFDSEIKIMELLWDNGPTSAKNLSVMAQDRTGWNKNTTYTIIKKLIEKNAVKREEPNFVCIPLITREQVQLAETSNLINKLYKGSKKLFFASFIQNENLSKEEIEELRRIIEKNGK